MHRRAFTSNGLGPHLLGSACLLATLAGTAERAGEADAASQLPLQEVVVTGFRAQLEELDGREAASPPNFTDSIFAGRHRQVSDTEHRRIVQSRARYHDHARNLGRRPQHHDPRPRHQLHQGTAERRADCGGLVGSAPTRAIPTARSISICSRPSSSASSPFTRATSAHMLELARVDVPQVDMVASLTHTDAHYAQLVEAWPRRASSRLIDDPGRARRHAAQAQVDLAALGADVHPLALPDARHGPPARDPGARAPA